jgi:glutaredoxin
MPALLNTVELYGRAGRERNYQSEQFPESEQLPAIFIGGRREVCPQVNPIEKAVIRRGSEHL